MSYSGHLASRRGSTAEVVYHQSVTNEPLKLIEFTLSPPDSTAARKIAVIADADDVNVDAAHAINLLVKDGLVPEGTPPENIVESEFPGAAPLVVSTRRGEMWAAILDFSTKQSASERIFRGLLASVEDGGRYGIHLIPIERFFVDELALLPGERPKWAVQLLTDDTYRADDARTVALRAAATDLRDYTDLVIVTKTGTDVDVPLDAVPAPAVAGVSTVDLGMVYRLSGIRLSSDGAASGTTPTVEVSNDGTRWLPLDVTPEGAQLRFDRVVRIRHLRLTTEDTDWRALTRHRDYASRVENKFLSARRPDGLGGRLAALLNVIRLAPLLGLDYRFTWPDNLVDDPQHAVPNATELFSEEYWAAHGDTEAAVEAQPSVKPPKVTELEGAAITPQRSIADLEDELIGLNGYVLPLERLEQYVDAPGIEAPYAEEFASIGFSPEATAALDRARSVDLPEGAVGLHVRSGNIVFGGYRRYAVHTRKVISLPVAKALVTELEKRGHTVVLFGQDEAIAAELTRDSAVVRAGDLLGDLGHAAHSALAEIVLLSRLELVVARNSAFAEQASSISGIPLVDPAEYLSPLEQVRVTDELLATMDADPLVVAFAQWSSFYIARDELETEESLRILSVATESDPANPLYPLTKAVVLYSAGRTAEADAVLAEALRTTYPEDMGTILSTFTLRMGAWFLLDEYFPVFEAAAAADSAVAQQFVDARDAELAVVASKGLIA